MKNTKENKKTKKLQGRKAECVHCDKKIKSNSDLDFFEYRPTDKTDLYYCGCYGWN